jgi:hypothetical protein
MKEEPELKEFNDYHDRVLQLSIVLSDKVLCFPKVISTMVAEYSTLQNVLLGKVLADSMSLYSLAYKRERIPTHESPLVWTPYPLSQSLRSWSVQTTSDRPWSIGLYNPKTKQKLEIHSKCPEYDEKKKDGIVRYLVIDGVANTARIHPFSFEPFDVPYHTATFFVDLEGKCVWMKVESKDIRVSKFTDATFKLIWSDVSNLQDFHPCISYTFATHMFVVIESK